MQIPNSHGPHGNQSVVISGNTSRPEQALILFHGRGAQAENIMQLSTQLILPEDLVLLAPQAVEYTWYPERFIVPQTLNQPYLDSALERIIAIVQELQRVYGISSKEITLAGFSQGACLVAEYLKQHPTQYKGAVLCSGGLIGTDIEVTTPPLGNLENTPLYIGCDTNDAHIPKYRVEQSAAVFTHMHAAVELHLYTGLGHSIHPDGIAAIQRFITA